MKSTISTEALILNGWKKLGVNIMHKTYKTEEIFEDIPGDDENVLMNIPDEICKELNIKPGDEVKIHVENGTLILQKI